jgi:transcriptional regulator with XRE-family HTH domain
VASAEGDNRQRASGQRAVTTSLHADAANPTICQRELGIRLRELRNGLGLTIEEAGERLVCSAAKISRLETGARRASLRDVRDLCRIYGLTDQAEADELMDLARQAREPGWWTRYEDLGLSPYIGLEQEATAITSFSMYYVPALMQTSDYARAIIKGIARRLDDKVVDQRVEARMRRQQLLELASPLRYRALVDEAVLHRRVGGSEVIRDQLDKLLRCAADGRAEVQVIPLEAGEYGGIDSNFDLLEFGEAARQGPIVFVEGLFSNLYQERPDAIERYREAIGYLRDSALSPQDSIGLITKIRAHY